VSTFSVHFRFVCHLDFFFQLLIRILFTVTEIHFFSWTLDARAHHRRKSTRKENARMGPFSRAKKIVRHMYIPRSWLNGEDDGEIGMTEWKRIVPVSHFSVAWISFWPRGNRGKLMSWKGRDLVASEGGRKEAEGKRGGVAFDGNSLRYKPGRPSTRRTRGKLQQTKTIRLWEFPYLGETEILPPPPPPPLDITKRKDKSSRKGKTGSKAGPPAVGKKEAQGRRNWGTAGENISPINTKPSKARAKTPKRTSSNSSNRSRDSPSLKKRATKIPRPPKKAPVLLSEGSNSGSNCLCCLGCCDCCPGKTPGPCFQHQPTLSSIHRMRGKNGPRVGT
jgi:hypothetical protein